MPPALPLVLLLAAAAAAQDPEFAPIDGVGNLLSDPNRGATLTPFHASLFTPTYADGVASMTDGPPARLISNQVFGSQPFEYNAYAVSYMNAVWGQFVAHDLVLTSPDPTSPEDFHIEVPTGDPHMDPDGVGNQTFPFHRNRVQVGTGTSTSNPRVQINAQTAFLDASTVYGATTERLMTLRTFYKGTLHADRRDGCPVNPDGHDQAGPTPATQQRLTGDVRGNVNPGLLALHGLWVLEHNRLCEELSTASPTWDDERLFQEARKRVIGMIQAITYYEYIPVTFGVLPAYTGYDPSEDPAIDPMFATAAYRYGHSGINTMYTRLNADGTPHPGGPLLLRDSYFNPTYLLQGGIAPILRGLLFQPEAEIDASMVDDVRNFLINLRDDLAAQDIMRGRDFGLPKYGEARRMYRLSVPATWAEMTNNLPLQQALASVYAAPEEVDLWVGGLCEPQLPNSLVGELFHAIIGAQMERTRASDRFWFEGDMYDEALRAELKATRLADVLRRNTAVDVEGSAFLVHTVPIVAFADGAVGEVPSVAVNSTTAVGTSTTTTTARQVVEVNADLTMAFDPAPADATDIELEFTLQGVGWLGFGVGSGMADADIVLMSVVEGVGAAVDTHSTAYAEPTRDDEQNMEVIASSEADGVTSVTIRRPIAAGNTQDKAIDLTAATPLIFAWSTSSDTVAYHGGSRVKASVTFAATVAPALSTSTGNTAATATTTTTTTTTAAGFDLGGDDAASGQYDAFRFHGMAMGSVWLVIVPFGALICRIGRFHPMWLTAHKWTMVLAATLTLPAAASGLTSWSQSSESASHFTLGFALCAALMLELFLGAVTYGHRQSPDLPPAYFRWLRLSHGVIGWSIVALGALNVYKGVTIMAPHLRVVVLLFVGLEAGVVIGGQAWFSYHVRKTAKVRLSSDGIGGRLAASARSITRGDVAAAVAKGQQWVLVGSHVYNVSSYANEHPGGAYLIKTYAGNDIAAYFFGNTGPPGHFDPHPHSTRAQKLLDSMFIGVLREGGEDVRTKVTPLTSCPSSMAITTAAMSAVEKYTVEENVVVVGEGAGMPGNVHRIRIVPVVRKPLVEPLGRWKLNQLGTHVLLSLPGKGQRPYSITREPRGRGYTLYVRPAAGGRFAKHLVKLRPGEGLGCHGPLGVGICNDVDMTGTVCAVVQGTGMVPFLDLLSLLEYRHGSRQGRRTSALGLALKPPGTVSTCESESGSGSEEEDTIVMPCSPRTTAADNLALKLLVCLRRPSDLVEAERLLDLAARLPTFTLALHCKVDDALALPPAVRKMVGGRLSDAQLMAHLPSEDVARIVICGSQDFQCKVRQQYKAAGVPAAVLHILA